FPEWTPKAVLHYIAALGPIRNGDSPLRGGVGSAADFARGAVPIPTPGHFGGVGSAASIPTPGHFGGVGSATSIPTPGHFGGVGSASPVRIHSHFFWEYLLLILLGLWGIRAFLGVDGW